jgi:hypothetical protein
LATTIRDVTVRKVFEQQLTQQALDGLWNLHQRFHSTAGPIKEQIDTFNEFG